MFGELEDSDIYENSPGGYGENSGAGYSNYGFDDDEQKEAVSDFDEDIFADTEPSPSFNQGYEAPVVPDFQEQQQAQATQEFKKKSSVNPIVLYALILTVLCAAAAGMFYYKQNSAPVPSSEQAMGDYFYDKASGSNPEAKAPSQTAASDGMATVDVDLTGNSPSPTTQAVQPAQPDVAIAPGVKPAKPAESVKPVNALEKAAAKQKLDAARENGISIGGRAVTVAVTGGGRVDPFMPYNQGYLDASKRSKFDLIAPPLEIPEADPIVDEIMTTKISGIMYDKIRPSAIVNFGANDQLVHKGDIVKGYKILDITKNKVVIKYKTNVYQAEVGQTLNEGVNLNPVSTLSRQFGGAYTRVPKNIIQFNN